MGTDDGEKKMKSTKKQKQKQPKPIPKSLPKITQPIVNPKITKEVVAALEADDPQALDKSFGAGNPFAVMHPLIDGGHVGIQVVAAIYRAWDCLLWLEKKIFAKELPFRQIGGDLKKIVLDDHESAMSLLTQAAFAIKDPDAISAYKKFVYWRVKLATPTERDALLAQHEKDTDFTDAYRLVLSEDEVIALDDPNVSRVPKEPKECRPPKGPKGGM